MVAKMTQFCQLKSKANGGLWMVSNNANITSGDWAGKKNNFEQQRR